MTTPSGAASPDSPGSSDRRFALVDCNNFYASCEVVFNPKLARRPLVVLSNNDGCVVSRSAEAKAIGIKMAEPWHHVRPWAEPLGAIAYSSNYTLYADMSSRVMRILGEMAPEQEVYSIDESFLDLTGVRELPKHAAAIRQRIRQWTGLPVCVGVGSTKTRAKLANEIAKKTPGFNGVFDLEAIAVADQDRILGALAVDEVWGVGFRTTKKLAEFGIKSVTDLRDAPAKRLRESFSVVLERIVAELNGTACHELELVPPVRKQIISSRSFGKAVTSLSELQEAAISYVSIAAEKLRRQQSIASVLQVSIETNVFKPGAPQLHRAMSVKIPNGTDDTLLLAKFAAEAVRQLYRSGYEFKKVATMLSELSPKANRMAGLFEDHEKQAVRSRLNELVDSANLRFGRNAVSIAGAGREKSWSMKRAKLSSAFTTNYDELPKVL